MPEARLLADRPPLPQDRLRRAVLDHYLADEDAVAHRLLGLMAGHARMAPRVEARARVVAQKLRESTDTGLGVEAFMHAYSLSSHEGVMLMCLAEALLRIPDVETQDELIKDKLHDAQWQKRVSATNGFLMNASAYGLMLSGRVMGWDRPGEDLPHRLRSLVGRLGEPVVREAMRQSMKVLGRQFVLGQTIEDAIDRARKAERGGFRYSYDMLGEAARTAADAGRYFKSYTGALRAIAKGTKRDGLMDRPGLSIKLSALHPRYEIAQWRRLRDELLPRLETLLAEARERDIAVTIDAEESERLEPSLDLVEALARSERLKGWNGLGIVVQAYQKRALPVILWLQDLAGRTGRRIPVRLVKGAYWDAEIKRAQQEGLDDFPVFTRKVTTDVSYLACADALLDGGDAFYPQFATHNAHTLSWVLERAGNRRGFEFQKLHGMGDTLYQEIALAKDAGVPTRVYAPVGSHADLLPYLVRRLLENGANSSFVHQIVDPNASLDALVADPVAKLRRLEPKRHPGIRKPADLYAPVRRNAAGINLADPKALDGLAAALAASPVEGLEAAPGVEGAKGTWHEVQNPADRAHRLGRVLMADAATAVRAVELAAKGAPAWAATPVRRRAEILRAAADRMEDAQADLLALCVREAGKSLRDAVADLREAVDFLRYYAVEAERLMGAPVRLPGPTGEENELHLHPRGVFVTISPWNFPIAIFAGQTAAALAAGNAVVAKPAEQTSLVGAAVVACLHAAGVSKDALVLLTGEGHVIGSALVTHPAVAGVAFTGSNAAAFAINRAMAATDLPIRPLIAETGGINAMIVDNSALPEQVVVDAVESAFRSAGQRCSALRLVCVQEETAPKLIEMLEGAMDELELGDPGLLATDVGPVIDEEARDGVEAHLRAMGARVLHRTRTQGLNGGTFVAPALVRLDSVADLEREVFGPVLHLVTYKGDRLESAIDAINAKGYGLTFGVQSRIDNTIERAVARVHAGNVYVNRNVIGAVVGTQPFGGEGLSGTGPKAGGPHYLLRFLGERVVSVNTAAVGGNLALLGELRDS
ncbi:MAG: bifunctional proline dehydrogenase/L-glutamate gamma-semialdehyde dehydrogenase PutA [Geminicoccaceae bacterium]|nr:bifunctional proline dehydrogenase/L-glutamate gamma-semialdehyde dehydrogenase PutA [Geminicoccaceae bacterium]